MARDKRKKGASAKPDAPPNPSVTPPGRVRSSSVLGGGATAMDRLRRRLKVPDGERVGRVAEAALAEIELLEEKLGKAEGADELGTSQSPAAEL